MVIIMKKLLSLLFCLTLIFMTFVPVSAFAANEIGYLVEDFIRTKMNMISDKINGMFKIVSFKLFAEQINGGIKETCECTVNGVPLSSLNNGHRIVAGLDIIHSLSNLYGVSCPIFVDNAESINDFNVPEMDAQMIYLTVTDDKELKVESEDK